MAPDNNRLVVIHHNWKDHIIQDAIRILHDNDIKIWTWRDPLSDTVLAVRDTDAVAAWNAVDHAARRQLKAPPRTATT